MQTLFEFYYDQVFYQLKGNNFGKEQLFRKGKAAKIGLLLVTGNLSLAAWYFGFYLLMLFGIIGTFDLLSGNDEQNKDPSKNIVPMTNTGILLTLLSYAGLLAVLLWLSVIMADSGIPGTNLPLIFISS